MRYISKSVLGFFKLFLNKLIPLLIATFLDPIFSLWIIEINESVKSFSNVKFLHFIADSLVCPLLQRIGSIEYPTSKYSTSSLNVLD